MGKYVKARPGYKFTLTELGFDLPKIRAKYDPEYYDRRFEGSVPEKWIRDGYVKEVEADNGEIES